MTITGAALYELLSRGPTFMLQRLARLPLADSYCRSDVVDRHLSVVATFWVCTLSGRG
jgi:hypothetical protein